MKRYAIFNLFTAFVMTSFAQSSADVLRSADLAFSQLSLDQGMRAAFLAYADEQVIKLNNKQFAVRGKADLEKWLGDGPEDFKLEWKPVVAEIASSGDLGYTFGRWRMTLADGTFHYGEYVTIWKKQGDGNWKFVLDGGNATPDDPGTWE